MESNTIKQKVLSYIEENSLSVSGLERKAGLKPRTLYNLIYSRGTPRPDRLKAIAHAIGCTVDELVSEDFTPPLNNLYENKKEHSPSPKVEWDASLMREAIELVDNCARGKNYELDAEKAFLLIRKVYDFSLKSKNKESGKPFAEWLIEEISRNT